ncbi:NADH-quinone oxidoreductase subunit C [Candidatus Bandiella euplotis]|uniref:NADH-quinone oxidoreductase subunit C n=1 Tax=Candidatus Bandiella euplotis TaxID=1664265 RepID=A0ABZ0UMV9_9RICK|nr:NADH-quinone oxidoreductase subunit C [Candidatus Bandiella woodruffii]WPX96135.1 NADH-quinone oxidoreductase subunit C [Candidatus Bandiella woodruffii]
MQDIAKLHKDLIEDQSLKMIIEEIEEKNGELSVKIRAEHLTTFLFQMRDGMQYLFKVLLDVCAVDYPGNDKRFVIVYHLLSIEHNLRIRVKVWVNEDDFVPTIKDIFSSSHWYEREVWDMYGILFIGNDDLRRILTDYGFSGYPMRKDFPLTGYVEVRYDAAKQGVVYESVKLAQEYRNFDCKSPWEGEDYILPGDEKASK